MRYVQLGSLLALVAVGLVLQPETSAAPPSYYLASSIDAPLAQEACWLCDWCNSEHTKTEMQYQIAFVGYDHPGPCDFGLCNGLLCYAGGLQNDDMAQVWEATKAGDVGRLRQFIAEYPEGVWFNSERGAIQFSSSCAPGLVIGSIPVSPDVAQALED